MASSLPGCLIKAVPTELASIADHPSTIDQLNVSFIKYPPITTDSSTKLLEMPK